MTTQHTPTPWHVESDIEIWCDTGGFVAMTMTAEQAVGTAEDYANAAFIVRAVNAHAALVEALEAVISVADRKTVEFDLARAALAKAKE